MSKRVWEADAAAGQCYVVYEVVNEPDWGGGRTTRTAVLTVWDTQPPQLTGRPRYTQNGAIRTLLNVTSELNGGTLLNVTSELNGGTLLNVTSELNGGTLPESVMDAVLVTMELMG